METCTSGSEGGVWKRTETYLARHPPYLLDRRNRVMETAEVYKGSVSSSQIRIGEVFKEAIRKNASALIVIHNHPSGDPTPSPDDVAVTRAIVQAGKLLDVDVLDHLVIGQGRWVSLKERGLGFA